MEIKRMAEHINSVSVRKKAKRLLAAALAILMVNPATGYGVAAYAQETEVITAFAQLSDGIATQQLVVGAEESDIHLPDTLNVTVSISSADTAKSTEEESQPDETAAEEHQPDEGVVEEPQTDETSDGDSAVSGNDAEEPQEEENSAEDNTATDSEATVVLDSGEIPLAASTTGSVISTDLDDVDTEQTETEKMTSEERTLMGITWQINAERSGSDTFDSESAGAVFFYEPVLRSGYALADGVSLPQIEVRIEDGGKWAFSQSQTIDGIEITVKAEKDVFPEGAVLHAKKVTNAEDKEKIQSAVSEEVQSADTAKTVTELVSFDITITDEEGNELQPDTSKGEVWVSFAQLPMVTEDTTPTQELKVFHMDDTLSDAQGLDTTVDQEAGTLEVPAEHFSLYTVALLTATAEDGEASVTNAEGAIIYYATVEKAVEAALGLEGATVTLLKDPAAYVSIVDMKGEFTLDLNGKTWSGLGLDVGIASGSLKVHVKDSVGSGKMGTLACGMRSSATLAGGSYDKLDFSKFTHTTVTLDSILEDGYVYKNTDGTIHQVTEDENSDKIIRNVSVKRQVSATLYDGAVVYYRSLDEALAAQNLVTIKLLDDIVRDNFVAATTEARTIDLNGKSWTCRTAGTALILRDCRNITITDSSAEAIGRISSTGGEAVISITGSNTENIVIEKGRYSNTGGMAIKLDADNSRMQLRINGGTFINGSGGSVAILNGGTCHIFGGTFSGELSANTSVRLSGGSFSKIRLSSNYGSPLNHILGSERCYKANDGQKLTGEGTTYLENVEVIQAPITITGQNNPNTQEQIATVPLSVNVKKAATAVGEITYQWYQRHNGSEYTKIAGATTAQYFLQGSFLPGSYNFHCVVACDGLELTARESSNLVIEKITPTISLKLFEKDGTEIPNGGKCTTDAYFKVWLKYPDGTPAEVNGIRLSRLGQESNDSKPATWDGTEGCYITGALGDLYAGEVTLRAGFRDFSHETFNAVWSEEFTFTATKVKKDQNPLSTEWEMSIYHNTTQYGTGNGKLAWLQLDGGPSPFHGMYFYVQKDNGVLTGYENPNYEGVYTSPFNVIGAGTVTVTAVRVGDADYNDATVSKEITIAKGDAPSITFPTASNIAYGQKLSDSSLTGGSTQYGTFAWTNGDIIPTVSNSGYEVTFTPNADTIKNYETISGVTGNVSISVSRATPVVTVSAAISGNTGSRQATLTATVTGSGDGDVPAGTVQFVNTTGGSSVNIGSAITLENGTASFDWTGLADQSYTVKAVYSGNSNYNTADSSEMEVDIRKQNQAALVIGSISPKTYGDNNFVLSATGGSGTGAVTFESSDPTIVSIAGTTATIHKAGTVTITSTKAANSTYNEATASVSLTVGKKTLTIKANDQLKIIKGAAMPALTYIATGLVGSDTFTSPTISTTATDTGTVGEYAITISGGTLANADSYSVTYTNGKLTVVNVVYAVTVTNGTGGSSYSEGQTVTITADSRNGYTFTGWSSSDGVTFANSTASTTTFIMPDKAVTVTANYSKNNSGDGGGSSGGGSSSSGGSSTTTPAATPEKKPDQPVTAAAPVTATAGKNDTASASIPDKTVTDAIAKAQSDVTSQGKTANGISVELNVTMPKGATSLTAALTRSSLDSLVSAGVNNLEINCSLVQVSFDKKALVEIQKQSTGNISISIAPKTNLSDAAKKIIGTRPVYDITVGYGSGKSVSSFGGGIATVSIPYTLGKNEAVGGLYAVYVDAKNNATRIASSAYDVNSGCVIFTTIHFSQYGIGYTAPSAKFTDINTHWAKDSVDYVVGRGLLSGTSDTAFSPNSAMTRGMLVTALGRLADVDVKAYTTNSFTDVKADSTFRPYIEWAYKKGIVQGIGNQQFAPDRAITREEIAVIFANYAKATGYTLPVTREATAYADASSIDSTYNTAVTAMQQAGIMMGGTNNKFNPKSSATRAEVSSMLHRYIKLTIDPATAQGWAKNDAGQYLYYKNGKPVTNTQTIDGVKYFFETTGVLKTGWVQDGNHWRFYSGNIMLVGFWDLGANGNNKTYYFSKDGLMVSGKWLEIDGKWYYFYADGSLARSSKVDGYEVDANGMRKTQ